MSSGYSSPIEPSRVLYPNSASPSESEISKELTVVGNQISGWKENKITVAEATKALHLVGQAQRMIQSNVSVQSAMEYMVLAYWKK